MLPRGWLIGNIFYFKTKSLIFTVTMIKWAQPELPSFIKPPLSWPSAECVIDSCLVCPVASGSERGWDNSQGVWVRCWSGWGCWRTQLMLLGSGGCLWVQTQSSSLQASNRAMWGRVRLALGPASDHISQCVPNQSHRHSPSGRLAQGQCSAGALWP